MTEPRKTSGNQSPSALSYASLGFEVVVPVGLFAYGGYWFDGRLGSEPWLLIVGTFLGMAVGFYSLFKRAMPPRDGSSGGRD